MFLLPCILRQNKKKGAKKREIQRQIHLFLKEKRFASILIFLNAIDFSQ